MYGVCEMQAYVENLRRVVEGFPDVLSPGVACVTALTNALLSGPRGGGRSGAEGGSGSGASSLVASAEERAAHDSHLAAAHASVQAELASTLRWYTGLLDACSSLQGALDGKAGASGGGSGGGAERCRELLGELRDGFAAECAVRAAVASSLLPQRCWRAQGAAASPYALPRADEGDREALTLCVAAWAVPAHTSTARSARILAALRDIAGAP